MLVTRDHVFVFHDRCYASMWSLQVAPLDLNYHVSCATEPDKKVMLLKEKDDGTGDGYYNQNYTFSRDGKFLAGSRGNSFCVWYNKMAIDADGTSAGGAASSSSTSKINAAFVPVKLSSNGRGA